MKDLLSLLPFVLDRRGLDLTPTPLQLWRVVYKMPFIYEQFKYSHPEGSIGTMLIVLTSIRGFGATDPRDRIFAILGITDEGLEPVYSITESNCRLMLLARVILGSHAESIRSLQPQSQLDILH